MAKKQTRKSISIRGTTYARLREYGLDHGESMSDITERALAAVIGVAPGIEQSRHLAPARQAPSPARPAPPLPKAAILERARAAAGSVGVRRVTPQQVARERAAAPPPPPGTGRPRGRAVPAIPVELRGPQW